MDEQKRGNEIVLSTPIINLQSKNLSTIFVISQRMAEVTGALVYTRLH